MNGGYFGRHSWKAYSDREVLDHQSPRISTNTLKFPAKSKKHAYVETEREARLSKQAWG